MDDSANSTSLGRVNKVGAVVFVIRIAGRAQRSRIGIEHKEVYGNEEVGSAV